MTAPRVHPGEWIIIFGAAAQVVRVERPAGFPTAHQLVLNPVAGPETTTLVPLDFEPLRIPGTTTTGRAR